MINEELIWEKEYGPFKAFGYVAPEVIDVEDIFDDNASKLNMFHLKEDIAYGKKIWVMAIAKVYCKGVELGNQSIGGLLYKDYDGLKKEVFEEDTHGIVHEALKGARASMKYLREVKIPSQEQLTSQFMEGQIW